MVDDWIFNLLADLRRFARANGLPALAAQIEVTEQVARVELAALRDGPGGGAGQGLRPR
ncbi:hypothetical protein [Gemmobacter serpentinus]|uniref:hypothetical protein n=1 Tax=Gemmobacter serpentinus TaxID=2652247 RepID=UPI0018658115|nr:hypothetical protein [Gemmobacter serpentinus]